MQLGNAIIFLVFYKEKCDFGVRNTERLGCSLIEHSGLLSTNLHLWLIIDKPPCPVKITSRAVWNILLASWYDACFWDTMILTYQEWLSKLFKLKKAKSQRKNIFCSVDITHKWQDRRFITYGHTGTDSYNDQTNDKLVHTYYLSRPSYHSNHRKTQS